MDKNCNNQEDQQKLIDEFIIVTEADAQTAKNYLEKHCWEVVTAINDYFEWMHQQYSQETTTSNHNESEEILIPSNSKKKFKKSDIIKSEQQRLFRHVTYNIDSLNEKNLKIRVQAICKILIKEKSTFVFLQEVNKESEIIIRQELSENFHMFSGFDNNMDYYIMTLIAKKPWIKLEDNKIINYEYTCMERNIIRIDVTIDDAKLCLLNTHLESCKEFGSNRKQQLAFLFRLFESINKKQVTIIAGGDLNLRDKELDEIGGLPLDVQDAWIATGRRKEVQYTWDMMRNDNIQFSPSGSKSNFKPRMRFDRVFVRRSQPSRIDLIHFGLIGLQRLKPYVCFPSDHWGVITSYQVYCS